MREELQLSPLEVTVVRGWFEGAAVVEIARQAGVHRALVARTVRSLRDRGAPLPERPDSWRARRQKAEAADDAG